MEVWQLQKFDKATIDRDEDDVVLCLLITEKKKGNALKKVWLMEDVKQLSEACMMCTIDGDTFFCLQRIPGSVTQACPAI